ncbi:MAG: hypothetical protein O6766_13655 [Gammaproteobacteria bacterium]|nr:hypothetical protein [Gammaproteobacteria bacterium]
MANMRATPTTDLEKARHELDVFGYCIVEDVAPIDLVERVMIRPLVNYPYSLRSEVVEQLDERQKQLLGFASWTAYGNEGVPAQNLQYFKPASDQPGPMRQP